MDISLVEMIMPKIEKTLDIVIDVGANLGEWSVAITALIDPKKIIAYEPIPEVFTQLISNTRDYNHILCKQSAIGSFVGNIDLNVFSSHQLSSVLNLQDRAYDIHKILGDRPKIVNVPITTLDDDLADYDDIAILKVDVQGYEAEVFKGAQQVLNRTRILITEIFYQPYYDGALASGELFNLITSLAPMKLWGISEPHCLPSGIPIWADAIFTRE
jgi:FkbM family methyltransferase